VPTSIDLSLSNECKRILAYAAEETERLRLRHIGTEHLLLGIFREEKCVAAEVLQQLGLRLDAIRQELARSTMPLETHGTSSPQRNELAPGLLKANVVPDEDTAKRIAEAVWIAQYGADTVVSQAPFKAELKFNVWIVTGSSSAEAPLFAWILQMDGRVLSLGRRTEP
jgi:ATP-dependent Clp protease ATP-binding subunit ClpA